MKPKRANPKLRDLTPAEREELERLKAETERVQEVAERARQSNHAQLIPPNPNYLAERAERRQNASRDRAFLASKLAQRRQQETANAVNEKGDP